ncbi:MAG: serine/threonine-protein kinase [Gemmatimonadota bacterium]
MSADRPDDPPAVTPPDEDSALRESGLGSGLLAQQPTPADDHAVVVLKMCPHCGAEYQTAARFCPNDGTALRPKGSDTLIDRVLADRYHILKRIGEGGMGRVYLGEHVKMNRQCAIKVMSPALINDGESAARFAREASNAARIIHPNVAAVFDYGESDGVVYLVMEYVEGEPLTRILAREAPLAIERAVELTRQIADGLGAAHELGIVHRDLKPDNILLTRTPSGREVAKVVDFGIAKAMQEPAHDALTRTGQVIGTPEFMSPEQLLGDPVDARSDLYALGCIFHMMLTASPPFDAPTRELMITRRLSEDAPHVHGLDSSLPDTLAGIVEKLLARTPGDRYGSAAELRDALAGTHVRRMPVATQGVKLARPTPRSAPTVAFLQATGATTEVTAVPPATPVRRTPFVLGIAGVAAVIAGFMMIQSPNAVDSERTASTRKDSVLAASVAEARSGGAPLDTDGGASGIAPIPMVDSARLATQRAEKRVSDSIARIAFADTGAVRSAIARYARAIESGDIAVLRAALPSMTSKQQESWERNFAGAARIEAKVRYGAMRILRDSADVEFSLALQITGKGTNPSQTVNLPQQHAAVARKNRVWQITGLR